MVKYNSTLENYEKKYSPRVESPTTSLLRRSDYKEKGQGNSVTSDILRKEHMGRIAIRDDWQPMTQKQLKKQA